MPDAHPDAHPSQPPSIKPDSQAPDCNPDRSPIGVVRIGCVSYLNSKPLIHGLEADNPGASCEICLDVPAGLLHDLEAGDVDLALCPVIDYFRSGAPLEIVPVGGIGSKGSTMTVRLYSRVPINRITAIHADTDSHTSVALVQVLLHAAHNIRPTMIDYHAREHVAQGKLAERPEAMLLIGDKVVTDAPNAAAYPYQLDLGEAWNTLTDLPFVFAVWMTRTGTPLRDTPGLLVRQRERNEERIDALVRQYAVPLGWPTDLAHEYLGGVLHYHIGPRELQAIRTFAEMAHSLGLIPAVRDLAVRDGGA